MRLAFVADIHGNLPALQAVAADIARHGVAAVVNLGDMLSGPLLPRETAHWLMDQPGWLHIAGNHDRAILTRALERQGASDAFATRALDDRARDWLGSVVSSTDASLHDGSRWATRLGGDVALCHGSPRRDTEPLLETPAAPLMRLASEAEIDERLGGPGAPALGPAIRLLACGHTHVPRAVRRPRAGGDLLIVNPGSVGQPAYEDGRGADRHWVESGSPDARWALAERGGDGAWRASLHSVPYDHGAMAALAEAHGRPAWAHALRHGRWPREDGTEKV